MTQDNPNNATTTKQPITSPGVSSATPFDTTTGQRLVTPITGSTPQLQTTPINASIIGNTSPLTIPQNTPTTAQNTLSATVSSQSQPENTKTTSIPPGWDATTYANFKAANPGLEPTAQDTSIMQEQNGQNSRQPMLDQIKSLIGLESNKGNETTRLQDNQDIAGKTQAVNDINNKILTTSRGYDEQIKNLEKNGTGYNGGNEVAIADLNRQKNEDLANLSIIKSTTLGDLDTANTIVKQKLDAEFEPLEADIKNYTDLYNLTSSDLTDSEKMTIQSNIEEKKQTAQNLYTAKQSAYKTALENGAPANVLAAIGSAATPEQAQQAVGSYGVSITNRLKLQKAAPGSGDNVPSVTPSYTLQAGDDPYTIAQNSGTDIATLQQLNPGIKDWHNIQPGVKLNLPAPKGQLSSNPTVDSYAQGLLNGSITSFASVPKQYKDDVAKALNAPGQDGYSPLAGSRYTMESNRIVNNFVNTPAYQLTAGGQLYLGRIAAAMKTPGSISDQDLLDSLTKLNTGGNAISDAQVKIITDGKSFGDIAGTLENKLQNGGVLSKNQRKQIQTIAKNIFENYQAAYQPVYDQATSQLKAAGIPTAFWTIPDLNKLNQQAEQNGNTQSSGSYQDYLKAIGQK